MGHITCVRGVGSRVIDIIQYEIKKINGTKSSLNCIPINGIPP